MIKRGLWLIALLGLLALAAWQWSPRRVAPALSVAPAAAGWVDEAGCQGCHAAEYRDWRGSHHQLAMQPATETSVLGDFADATLATDVETSRFSRREAAFWLNTPGADGRPASFQVAYTFGVAPLQQYLLALPDGRLQVHGAAWDVARQRWFHLYDGKGVDHRHRLHWSQPQQNADFMCIECHTTGFERGYDAAADRFDSRWQALGVGCQSCHGPAAGHLRWAAGDAPPALAAAKGFERSLAGGGDPREPEVCARCHSRRTPLGNGYQHGNDLLDDYLPMTLSADLYEVDGKIKDEVFEYGSFLQSRMHAAGVVCSDCHDPHRAELRAPGNAVCSQCHNPAATPIRAGIDASGLQARNYAHPSNHHHPAGSPGSQCVACHMPGKLYMGNDLRRDHSFSSPHPPQAGRLGHSDACLGCHDDGEAATVLARFERWYPGAEPRDGGYARALHAARQGLPGAAQGLLDQLARADLADIRRATLLGELANYPSPAAQQALSGALQDRSPLVRRSAVEQLSALLPPARQAPLLQALLDDPVRAVRLAASWQLLQLTAPAGADPQALRQLIAEYEQVQHSMLDRAESHQNLAGVYQLTGRQAEVEPALRRALRQDPQFHPARILLAHWHEQAGDGEQALRLLRDAIAEHPEEASLHHALGLTQVRQGLHPLALQAFRQAHALAPEHAEYGYVLAVALHSAGQRQAALELLRELLRQHPANRSLRQALIGYLSAAGEHAEAASLLRELAALNPQDPLLPRGSHTQ